MQEPEIREYAPQYAVHHNGKLIAQTPYIDIAEKVASLCKGAKLMDSVKAQELEQDNF